ncbi:MAG: helix-hairpin-helix domain-containing protein [Deltaproteobacteria bacterium]|nr:helix-hairpin-helix domain-containing protein [Deltaproteobacteria bacterium]MBW2018621.1 helix-hairpin-helix domain-containing protein [Deltaproteobacteria bacterium]MBW2073887.1 helix-hairpin-helix domain-containing protein [Deltaproteobacteria bacterium]
MKHKMLLTWCLVFVVVMALVPILSAEDTGKININQATVEELTQLDRIGPKYAERIVQYRQEHGPFERPEDIMKVQGIGTKTWEANQDKIVVE